jgi:AbrB family transcriptional regulator (stage V sporulation protein T)
MNGGNMTTTGIIRRIDELGRIVIPKEIRTNLRIKNGDNLEILVDGENIMLKKYSQIDNLEGIANMYAESFYQVLKYNVIITDTDKVVAVGGNLKMKYLGNEISNEISRMIERRDNFVERKKKNIEIIPGVSEFGYYTVATIINNGDSIGSVIILSLDTPMLEQEEKLGAILANILSNYFL